MKSDSLDLARARAETPAVRNVLHFNNAGSALMPAPVHQAVLGHLQREAEIGGYEAHDEAIPRLEAMYASLARLINASPDEIAFAENATRAWDMAFYSLPLKAGDRILTAEAEYASNVIAYLQAAKHRGVILDVVPSDPEGAIDVAALERMIDANVKLIAITHVPSQGGLINPAEEVGRIARKHGIPYLLDACQSVGQLPLDVEALGCDMLSATGRKFLRGPRGTGFLYVRRALIEKLEPVFLDLHAATWISEREYTIAPDAKRFENWESFVAGRIGLGAAADYAMGFGLEAIAAHNRHLAAQLRAGLEDIPGIKVHDRGREKSAIVTFGHPHLDAETIKQRLRAQGIHTSTSSPDYARFDLGRRKLPPIVRASPHYYNDESEIERFLGAIRAL